MATAPIEPHLWVVALMMAALAGGVAWLLQRRRQLHRELRDAREEQRKLADMLDVWQWRSSADHCITVLRPPVDSGTPAWAQQLRALPLWEQFRSADEAALRACVQAQAPIADLEATLGHADGSASACRVRGVPLTDAEGRFAGYLGTARIQPGAVTAPAQPPSVALAAARPTQDDRDSFTYTVSHDLRAPIRVVEGFARILKEDYGRSLDRIGNDHLDRVLAAAARMNCMIDALLTLSQLSTQPLACQPVNLSQLAGFIAEDLKRESTQRLVNFSIEPGMQVRGDPTLLRLVLENLLGNAWKYTGQRLEAQIWFGRNPHQPADTFTVRDNGAGFDMRFADRLFGVFQRLHSANDFQGSGVGLASVRRIVRRHGGDVWAEAEVDRGASFHFSLRSGSAASGD